MYNGHRTADPPRVYGHASPCSCVCVWEWLTPSACVCSCVCSCPCCTRLPFSSLIKCMCMLLSLCPTKGQTYDIILSIIIIIQPFQPVIKEYSLNFKQILHFLMCISILFCLITLPCWCVRFLFNNLFQKNKIRQHHKKAFPTGIPDKYPGQPEEGRPLSILCQFRNHIISQDLQIQVLYQLHFLHI